MTTVTAPTNASRLSDVCSKINEMSTLPHIALRVVEVANDPDCSSRDLKKLLESDVALSARVLRCVNSSAYARRTTITNLQQAIAYLGLKQIRNLALTVGVSGLFQGEASVGHYRRADLWKHLVAVGICSRLLAMRLRMKNFEDVFLAGLMHDVGIVLEDEYLHDEFVDAVHSLNEKSNLLVEERKRMGFDHTQLGEEMGKRWKLPEGVVTAIRRHHDSNEVVGELQSEVRCVEIANFICSLKGASAVGLNLVAFPRNAINAFSLSKDDLIVLADDLEKDISANEVLFQL